MSRVRPPFSFLGPDAKPARYSVDLCLHIAAAHKVDLGLFTVSPLGSPDSHTHQILDIRLQPITATSPKSIIFELKDLSYISGAGVRAILASQKAVKAGNGEVVLTNLQPQIRGVFDIIGAVPSPSIFENVEELDRSLGAMQKNITEGGA